MADTRARPTWLRGGGERGLSLFMNTDAHPTKAIPPVPADLAVVLERLPAEAAELVLTALGCSLEELHQWMIRSAGPAPVAVRVVRSFSRPNV